jgi:tetratricopeptide (TPR) repeat protein
MERFQQIFKRRSALVVTAALALSAAPFALGQEGAAKVHGHVQNPAGQPLTSGQVKFTKDLTTPFKDEKFTNTVDIDAGGNYTVPNVAPGEYFVYVIQGTNVVDRQQIKFAANEDKALDFDMTRAEYTASMTPEQKKALEEFKAKNAAAVAGNKQVANLNGVITSVRADIKSPTPNFDKDATDIKGAVEARPTEPILWAVQGEVLLAKADATAKADRANKTNPSQDENVTKSYSDSADSFKKSADLMAAAPKPNPEQQASVYNQLGTVYARSGKATDATAAFDKAADLDPKNKGMFYGNEAAILFNAQQNDAALAAAEKAIAADPTKPNPYYIKGQALLAKATVDAKGNIIPPPGCVDAYNKYLDLAPDGAQAPAVKDVLTSMGQKVTTRYKATGKK